MRLQESRISWRILRLRVASACEKPGGNIGIPNTDGHELVCWICRLTEGHGGKVPAFALTAYVKAEDRLRTFRVGYQMHVPKQIEGAKLIAVTAGLAE